MWQLLPRNNNYDSVSRVNTAGLECATFFVYKLPAQVAWWNATRLQTVTVQLGLQSLLDWQRFTNNCCLIYICRQIADAVQSV